MTHVTCRLTAKNRDQLWNPTLGNRALATFTFFLQGAQQQTRHATAAIDRWDVQTDGHPTVT